MGVKVGCVEHPAMQQLQAPQVVLEAMAHQERLRGEQASNLLVDVVKPRAHICHHRCSDPGVSGVVVGYRAVWQHQLIE